MDFRMECLKKGSIAVLEWLVRLLNLSFDIWLGLRQGCVMSPWFFNVYMDGVVRKVNVRVYGQGLDFTEKL